MAIDCCQLAKSWGVDPGLVARAEEHYQRLKAQEAGAGRKERLLIEVNELLRSVHVETPRPSFEEACAEIRACATDPDTGEYIGIDDGESDDIIDEAPYFLRIANFCKLYPDSLNFIFVFPKGPVILI